ATLFSHTLPDALHIAPGSSRNISFSFTPTEIGGRSVELRMRSNDTDAPQPVLSLTGNGVAYQRPRIEVRPSGINLPFTYYGYESSTEFVIYNTGTAPLHIAGIENQTLPPFEGFPRETYYPYELTIHPGSPRRVEIGDSLNVTVLYNPLAENSRQVKFSWVVISSDDPAQPELKLHVNASAGNAPIVGLNQYHMEFPAVPIRDSLDVSLGVYSKYDGRLRSAKITGPDAAHFDFIGPVSFDTRPDRITVRYHQGESGKRVAHLTLETNDLLAPVLEILLVGYDDATMSLHENASPDELTLEAWPNPFSTSTTLTCVLSRPGPLHMHLLDMTGRVVRSSLHEEMAVGRHTLRIDRDGLPDGLYFVRLRSGDLIAMTRLLLLSR
ncbi:MAG: T9SS type A sorting domain-containing protein, partial [Bacteroidetes bacterium]|nr:T9SS type A sorting domain-containing protein [Bacteroidota bacterium]